MRKVTVLVLVAVFMFASLTFAGAEVESTILTKEQAAAQAREMLDIGKGYQLENASFEERSEPTQKFWYLHFRQNKAEHWGSVSVRIDAETGTLLAFDRYDSKDEGERQAVITREEAKQLAMDIIKKFQPDKLEQLKLAEEPINRFDSGSTLVSFNFGRLVRGYPYRTDGFRITVNTGTKAVSAYDYRWSEDVIFPDVSLVMPLEEAVGKMKRIDKTRLIYIMERGKDGEELGLKPVYDSRLPGSGLIDAVTGELIAQEDIYRGYYYGYAADETPERKMAAGRGGDAVETVPEEGVISKEQAVGISQTVLGELVDFKGLEVSQVSYRQYRTNDDKEWYIYWRTPNPETDKQAGEGRLVVSVSVSLDAVSGQITNISYQGYRPDVPKDGESKGFTFDQLQSMASKVVKQVFPEQLSQVQFVEEEERYGIPRPMLQEQEEVLATAITAERMLGDVPFPENQMYFSFDPADGELRSFSYRWQEVEVPGSEDVLSLGQAEDIYYAKAGVAGQYIQLQQDYKKPLQELKLAYGVKQHPFRYIDALNGALLDHQGQVVEDETEVPLTDVKGHWAERTINLLFDQGVIRTEDGLFRPNAAATRQEAVKMLTLANGFVGEYDTVTFKDVPADHPYHKYVEAAARMGIIDQGDGYFYPEKEVKREQFAVMLVRMAGLKKAAEIEGIYQVPFKDQAAVAADKLGYVALAGGLKIFQGTDGYFHPKQSISRAEAVVALYRTNGVK